MNNKLKVILVVLLIGVFLSGCQWIPFVGGDRAEDGTQLESFAVDYMTNVTEHRWDQVIQDSTGDQLSVFLQLMPVLERNRGDNSIRRIEIVDETVHDKLAYVTVHRVVEMNVDGYGSALDDKQVLLSIRQVDGEWKVFRMDTLHEASRDL